MRWLYWQIRVFILVFLSILASPTLAADDRALVEEAVARQQTRPTVIRLAKPWAVASFAESRTNEVKWALYHEFQPGMWGMAAIFDDMPTADLLRAKGIPAADWPTLLSEDWYRESKSLVDLYRANYGASPLQPVLLTLRSTGQVAVGYWESSAPKQHGSGHIVFAKKSGRWIVHRDRIRNLSDELTYDFGRDIAHKLTSPILGAADRSAVSVHAPASRMAVGGADPSVAPYATYGQPDPFLELEEILGTWVLEHGQDQLVFKYHDPRKDWEICLISGSEVTYFRAERFTENLLLYPKSGPETRQLMIRSYLGLDGKRSVRVTTQPVAGVPPQNAFFIRPEDR